jgi:hypothetical protein
MRIQLSSTIRSLIAIRAERIGRAGVLFGTSGQHTSKQRPAGMDSINTAPVNFTNEDIC